MTNWHIWHLCMGLVSYPCKNNLIDKMKAEVANSRMVLNRMLGCKFNHFVFIIDDFFWQRRRATPNKQNTFSDARDVTTSCVKEIDAVSAVMNGRERIRERGLPDPFLGMDCGHLLTRAIAEYRRTLAGRESRCMKTVLPPGN